MLKLSGAVTFIALAAVLVPTTVSSDADAAGPALPPAFDTCDSRAFQLAGATSADPSDLYAQDLATGQLTLLNDDLGSANDVRANAIGYSTLDNRIYGIEQDRTVDGVPTGYLTVIGKDAVGDRIGPVPGLDAVESNLHVGDVSAGRLYATNSSAESVEVYVIDVNPSSATFLTILRQFNRTDFDGDASPPRTGGDWAFQPGSNQLYTIDDGSVLTVDANIGEMERVLAMPSGLGSTFGSVWFDSAGLLYAFDNASGQIYRIDLTAGIVTPHSDSGVTLTNNDGARCAGPANSDTTPPDTTVDSGPSETIATRDVAFGFSSSEPNSIFECKLDGPGALTATFGSCLSPKEYVDLADGLYTFSVQARDPAGNTDQSPATRTFTVTSEVPPSCTIGDPDATKIQSLRGTSGADVICGGAGNDVIYAYGGNDIILAGGGIDRVNGGDGHDTANGGTGVDRIVGGNGDDTLSGGDGNDTVNGGNGDDNLAGGDGNDALTGSSGNDTLAGDAGKDTLSAGSGGDTLSGGADDDKLYGSTDSDHLDGDSGADTLNGGFSADECDDDGVDQLASCESVS